MMDLPEALADALAPLLKSVPPSEAMRRLVGGEGHHTAEVEELLRHPALARRAALEAGLWLYVDDLARSHTVSQSLEGETGAYWHGIMHRREGDFSNARYWMRRAATHPLFAERPDLAPSTLVDLVAAADGRDDPDAVGQQREEWTALFEWCARQPIE